MKRIMVYCVIHNVYYIYILLYETSTEQYTAYSVRRTLHYTVYTVHCTVYTVHCVSNTVQCTVYSVQCTLCIVFIAQQLYNGKYS